MSIACPGSRHWLRNTFITWLCSTAAPSCRRAVSTSSAINRGLRAEKAAYKPVRRERPQLTHKYESNTTQLRTRDRASGRPVQSTESDLLDAGRTEGDLLDVGRGMKDRKPRSNFVGEFDVPPSIPRTTAASTFLYGSNTVLAALQGKRRKLYQLYVNQRLTARETNARAIMNLAKTANIPIHSNSDLGFLDRVAENRPHNGVVLEASDLPAPPVVALKRLQNREDTIPFELEHQNAESLAINGASEALPALTKTWRYPFVLMLDGILDPMNVGSILRTAHFFGVDAVAVSKNTCCSLASAALAKASSGACEALPLLSLSRPSNFVYASAKAGWNVYASVAPPPSTIPESNKYLTTSDVSTNSPLAKHPIILMMGAEGEGLRDNLKRRADYFVSIQQGRRADKDVSVGVDSLNVGVATAVLVESFMQKPQGVSADKKVRDLGW